MNNFYENKPLTNKVKSEFTHEEMDFLTLCQKMANMITPVTTFVVVNIIHDYMWRAPKFLVRPKKGPTMFESESSWNLVPLPASSTKGGERGMLKASKLD